MSARSHPVVYVVMLVPIAMIVVGLSGLVWLLLFAGDSVSVPAELAAPSEDVQPEAQPEVALPTPAAEPLSLASARTPSEAATSFTAALLDGKPEVARALLEDGERAALPELVRHGWHLEEVLPTWCTPASIEALATEGSSGEGVRQNLRFRYTSCQNGEETVTNLSLPVVQAGDGYRVALGAVRYLEAIKQATVAPLPYRRFLEVKDAEVGTWDSGEMTLTLTVQNFGLRALTELVVDVHCDVPGQTYSATLRAVDPHARLLAIPGGQSLAEPLLAGSSRGLETRLAGVPQECSSELVASIGPVLLAEAPTPSRWAQSGRCGQGPTTAKLYLPTGEELSIGRRCRIGRGPGNDLGVVDPAVSKKHALIELTGRGWVLRDLGSKNGTWLEGEPVKQASLPERAYIGLGETTLYFTINDAQ